MKKRSLVLLLVSLCAMNAVAQEDSTGLPGDNFSLEGSLELFKKADSPEAFEKMLNDQNSNVNNLDLNGDGQIDYIRVIDKEKGNAHAFILQDVVSADEQQDVAVIEVEKSGDANATVQIIGDEDLYGHEKIVEPVDASATDSGVTTAPSNVVVNVWSWPAVRYVYGPGYRVWVSPWAWGVRPVWWHPWHPIRYAAFYPYWVPYRHRYVVVNVHRTVYAHRIYAPVRTTSVVVANRHAVPVRNYRATHVATMQHVEPRRGGVRGHNAARVAAAKGMSHGARGMKRSAHARGH